jgi:hypothetical protein
MRVQAVFAVAVVTLGASADYAWAGGIDLVPHHATYSMDLATSESGSGIVGAHGTMSYDFSDTCDGWVVENRIAVTYDYTEGGEAVTTTDFVTWESKDGLKYRFRLRNTRDGQVTDEIEGTAQLRGKGKGGVAHYTRPEEMTMPLPKGTLFPTEHTQHLIGAARSGRKNLARSVFDGSDTQGAFDVNAFIGMPRPVQVSNTFPALNSPSWPVRLAFYTPQSNEPDPEFYMWVDYHDNGIASSIVQSFKGFSLSGQLQSLDILPKHGC